jgi:hypothetical protein
MYIHNKSSHNHMKLLHIKLKKEIKKGIIILSSIFVICFSLYISNPSKITINDQKQSNNDPINFKTPKISSHLPNSKPLLVYQHSTISSTQFPLSLPTDISFTLVEGWTSKNVTITYDGVSHHKDWVINGTFDTGETPWFFNTSDGASIVNDGWQSGYVGTKLETFKSLPKGSFGYFTENFTIPEALASNTIVTLSMNYMYQITGPGIPTDNISAYISIRIGDIKKNASTPFINLVEDNWTPMSLTYDLTANGQQLPNNVTLQAGVFVDNATTTGNKEQFLFIDDIKFNVWTNPNLPNLLIANDTEFSLNYSYQNTTYGKGYAFIDTERSKSETSDIIFTISKNASYIEEFEIYNITITSEAVKTFNSTIHGQEGSLYINDMNIDWQTECSFSIPFGYLDNWAELVKPSDWNATSILDGFGVETKGSCTGTSLGSEKIIIPNGVLSSGLWSLEFSSWNYIIKAGIVVWNGTSYNAESSVNFGDLFQINATLNNTIPFANTQVNCTLEYPNGTIFWQNIKTLTSHNINFGDFLVGKNMSVGNYQTTLIWTNNQTKSDRDKVGFLQFGFDVWHQTNLTAVNPYEMKVSGEPYLMKVEFNDYNINQPIDFATITFNSTYGATGTMAYLGSGIYGFDVDLSGLSEGKYYFSFNASKNFYENQSVRNFIELDIITQPLALEVPQRVINADANSYAICQVNITGVISGTLITGGVNITTDWDKDYTYIDHLNGTVTLNFSTDHLPLEGIIETYSVTVYASKFNYGSTSGFISITIHPIPTAVNVNTSIVEVKLRESFSLQVNYTVEESSELISKLKNPAN